MNYLADSTSELWTIAVAGLEGTGFIYERLTATRSEYLAAALGRPNDHLRKSSAQMLAELIAAHGGGNYSHLRTPFNRLLDILVSTLVILDEDGDPLLDEDGDPLTIEQE